MGTRKKLTAAILDDDIIFMQLLVNKIRYLASDYELDFSLTCFSNPQELEMCVCTYDVLFLDIES